MKKLNKKGFTLIELLAVIVIMAILVAVAIPAVTRYLDTARKGTYVDNAQAAVGAVRNEVITNSFSGSGSKMYYLNYAKGCYTHDTVNNKLVAATDKNLNANKSACLAGNTDPKKPTYFWSDGSINNLLEKKLKNSPYGDPYSDLSFIKVDYTPSTATAPSTYKYTICLVDTAYNGILNKTDDVVTSEDVVAGKNGCTPVNN